MAAASRAAPSAARCVAAALRAATSHHLAPAAPHSSLTLPPLSAPLRGREPLRPHPTSPPRPVPAHIPRPPYADSGKLPGLNDKFEVHDAAVSVKKLVYKCTVVWQMGGQLMPAQLH